MGFDVDKLREQTAAVSVKFHGQVLHARYYVGDKAKDLEKRLAQNIVDAQREYEADQEADEAEIPRPDREDQPFDQGRRDLCETLCMMISSWDLVMTLDDLVELVEELEAEREVDIDEEDREKRRAKYTGKGEVPLIPIFVDALPFPTSFHLKVSNEIGADMAAGGRSGKGR